MSQLVIIPAVNDQTLSRCVTTALSFCVISYSAVHSSAPTPPDSPPPSRKSVAALVPRFPVRRESATASRFRARAPQSPASIADDPSVFHLGDLPAGVAVTRMTASARRGAAAQTSPHESTHTRACGSLQNPDNAGRIGPGLLRCCSNCAHRISAVERARVLARCHRDVNAVKEFCRLVATEDLGAAVATRQVSRRQISWVSSGVQLHQRRGTTVDIRESVPRYQFEHLVVRAVQ